MSSIRKKRVDSIFNKIINISQKGNDYYLNYYNYIDDLLRNNEYLLLQDVFNKYFKTDIRQWNSIPILKQESWRVVTFNTNSMYMYRLKDYYNSKNVYQIGQKIYNLTTNQFLGKFVEIERLNQVNFSGATYSFPPYYAYYDNTDLYQLSSITYSVAIPGIAKGIILQVQIGTTSNYALLNDPQMSLLDKYKKGVQLLLQ